MKKAITYLLTIPLLLSVAVFFGCKDKDQKTTSYYINCQYQDNCITGYERVDFYNDSQNSFKQLKFNLYPNAYREGAKYKPVQEQHEYKAYYNGLNYGDIQIIDVLYGENKLAFEISGQDKNVLIVNLDKEIFPKESISITIRFNVKVANVISRLGVNEKTVNLANFYPILCAYDDNGFYECLYYSIGDPFYSQVANYTVEFTAPKKYIVATGASVKSQTDVGENVKYLFKADKVRSFAMVLGEFKVASAKVNDVTVNYYYYDDQNYLENVEYAKKSLSLFNKLFGRYPYPVYSVVKTPFIQGGMEFPTLVMVSDLLESQAFGEVIVHETAHQWWQSVVGNNEIEYGFLDEGLAEYSVVLFYENHPEYALKRQTLINSARETYRVFCSVSDKLFGGANTVMNRPLNEFKSEYEYVNMAYIKPCIMYDTLRTTVGDKKFFNCLKNYYITYAFKNATPDDLKGVFEKEGLGTNGFFDSFLLGKVIL